MGFAGSSFFVVAFTIPDKVNTNSEAVMIPFTSFEFDRRGSEEGEIRAM